jgi:hypothetical protein
MLKQTLIAFLIISVLGFFVPIFGQKADTIRLDNPSFEDEPSAAHTPKGWLDCGFGGQSPPDTHPCNAFNVTKKAFHGSTYLGLVVRDDNTWEGVKQTLKTPILKDIKYSFSLYLCRSKNYISKSMLTGKDANYIKPIILRIWGVEGDFCKKVELLAESKIVQSTDWEKHNFTFKSQEECPSILIEAYFESELFLRYNGNVLVDNLSDIVHILDKN